MRRKKRILIGIGVTFVAAVFLFILFIVNTSLQYKKLGQGELVEGFVCDTIPFSYSKTNHIVISARLNNSPKKSLFILDSGASNVVFRKYSKKYDLENNGFALAKNANKEISITRIKKIETLKIGNTVR